VHYGGRATYFYLMSDSPSSLFSAAEVDSLVPATHTPGIDERLDELVAGLLADGGVVTSALADLLGYWGRERRADITARFLALGASGEQMAGDPDVLSGLRFLRMEAADRGSRAAPLAVFGYDEQEVGRDLLRARSVVLQGEGRRSLGSITKLDSDTCEVYIRWTPARVADGFYPESLTIDDWVNPTPKPSVAVGIAHGALSDRTSLGRVSHDLLMRERPRFLAGGGPADGIFTDDLSSVVAWCKDLDESYLCIQGPPGTGKTYYGARIIHGLVKAGGRVGITALSHAAAENLLLATSEYFRSCGDEKLLRAVKKVSGDIPKKGTKGVTYAKTNSECSSSIYNVVVGTTWLFASEALLSNPVTTLVIDEAGQLSLADALVACAATKNLILLGDPQQLPQVTQSTHPGVGGASVLEHALGSSAVVARDRGVFLSTTWRMHPTIGSYISDNFYDGALLMAPGCENQCVGGAQSALGLLLVDHQGCRRESLEEAQAIASEIERLVGSTLVRFDGGTGEITSEDIIVVAPYNDQVDLITDVFDQRMVTRDVRVGTVDRFQGQEAAVVFYSMTASSLTEARRGAEFLLNANRLNVALSRARAKVYLVGSWDMLAQASEHALGAPVADFISRTEGRNI
jgi:hypothetical protein